MTRPEPVPGYTVWLTGLSGAGETTISPLVGDESPHCGAHGEVLDRDAVRTHLSKGLAYSNKEPRRGMALVESRGLVP